MPRKAIKACPGRGQALSCALWSSRPLSHLEFCHAIPFPPQDFCSPGLGERTHVNPQPAPDPRTPRPALRNFLCPREARGQVRSIVWGEATPTFPSHRGEDPQSCVSAQLRVPSPAPSLSPQTILEYLTVSVTCAHPQVPVPKPPFSAFQRNSARALPPPAPKVTRSNLPHAALVHPLLSPTCTRVQSSFQISAALPFSSVLVPELRAPTHWIAAPPASPAPPFPVPHQPAPLSLARQRPGRSSPRSSRGSRGRHRSAPSALRPKTFAPTRPRQSSSAHAGPPPASPSCGCWDGREGTGGPAWGRARSE